MDNRDFWMGYMMGSGEGDNGGSGRGDGSTPYRDIECHWRISAGGIVFYIVWD